MLSTYTHTCIHTHTHLSAPGTAGGVILVDNAPFWCFLRLIPVLIITPGPLKLERVCMCAFVFKSYRETEGEKKRVIRVYVATSLRLLIDKQLSVYVLYPETITVHRWLWSECVLSMTLGIPFQTFFYAVHWLYSDLTISHKHVEAMRMNCCHQHRWELLKRGQVGILYQARKAFLWIFKLFVLVLILRQFLQLLLGNLSSHLRQEPLQREARLRFYQVSKPTLPSYCNVFSHTSQPYRKTYYWAILYFLFRLYDHLLWTICDWHSGQEAAAPPPCMDCSFSLHQHCQIPCCEPWQPCHPLTLTKQSLIDCAELLLTSIKPDPGSPKNPVHDQTNSHLIKEAKEVGLPVVYCQTQCLLYIWTHLAPDDFITTSELTCV